MFKTLILITAEYAFDFIVFKAVVHYFKTLVLQPFVSGSRIRCERKWRETAWRSPVIFPPRIRRLTKAMCTRPGDTHLLMTTCITVYTDITSRNSLILRHLKHKGNRTKLMETDKKNPQVSKH